MLERLTQGSVDYAHKKGDIVGVYSEHEELWEYAFDVIDGLDFFFSDNPVEAMNVRDLLRWQARDEIAE